MWYRETEKAFFISELKRHPPDKLFYKTGRGEFLAYWPKGNRGKRSTLQSRNALIGGYTERWVENLLAPTAEKLGLYTVRGAVCEEMGLERHSPADVAICGSSQKKQKPEDIKLIIEIKMSVVWNWRYEGGCLSCIGDHKSHIGQPGLLRSDTMLKAIGKAVNIRMFSAKSARTPILILGNTPISKGYEAKVANACDGGIIQAMWSVNPEAAEGHLFARPRGFCQIAHKQELESRLIALLRKNGRFFSAYKRLNELGRAVEKANRKREFEAKARSFLGLIGGTNSIECDN